ncbi:unnamed protein product [Brassica oleracea var. botrytis]
MRAATWKREAAPVIRTTFPATFSGKTFRQMETADFSLW